MAANRDVRTFFELRAGFIGMRDFAEAALDFMDTSGIAMQVKRSKRESHTNGTGKEKDVQALAETAARMFKQKRKKRKGLGEAAEPDGKHVTAKEAGKMLKCSEANIRLMWGDGRLPKPTLEQRPWSKKQPDKIKRVQVIPVEAVKEYKTTRETASS